jgi:glycosyltransferase involved in cell wall biosynthesis|tara:strand:+ start:1160 stop:2170 length:1011 start_codon:yes stop_codon:yes gene_type:complete
MISVIIPCRNEELNIEECINAIYRNSFGQDQELEVIVVDGLSDDKTLEILAALQTQFNSLRVVNNVKKTTPEAFNLGIKNSKGNFIQIIGARQVISSNYLEGAKKTLVQDEEIWCVGGAVNNVYQTPESETIGLAMSSPFGVGGGNFRIIKESGFVDTVGTPMYKKEVFDEVGFFNEDLKRNQDDEFNYRVIKAGGKIFLNIDISLSYYVRAKTSNLYKQYMQYGYWKVYVNKLHNTITTIRQLVPLFFVLGIIGGILLSIIVPYFGLMFIVFLIIYFVLGLYFARKISKNTTQIFKVSRIFPILHWSYGYGYLKGIIHFFILNKKPSSNNKTLSR